MRIECAAVDLPEYPNHPNRLQFLGILGFVDTPSDASPSGARGHRVNLTRDAALNAIGSIVGMGVCHREDGIGHEPNRKIGVITKARLIGKRIVVRGILYQYDCPKDIDQIRKGKFGLSYELSDAHVPDLRKSVWDLTRVNFTGAAIVLADKVAYRNTRIWIGK